MNCNCETVDVVTAGARLGCKPGTAYILARKHGRLADGVPVIRVGRRLRVPIRALERVLCVETNPARKDKVLT